MSSINMGANNNHSVAPSIVSAQAELAFEPEQYGQFFSISQKYNSKLRKDFINQKKMDMVYNFRMKTQTRTQKETEVKEQKTRKTRKDKQGRIFKCGGCSNDYLSYPALYTHIKAKHGGIMPQGTIRGENGKVKKRGRPKSRRNPDQLYQRETFEEQFPKNLLNLVEKQKLAVLDEFTVQKDEEAQDATDITSKIFVAQLRILKKMSQTFLKTMSIIKVMTIFLYNIKDYVETYTMSNFEQFLEALAKFVNKNYHKILMSYAEEAEIYISNEKDYTTEKVENKVTQDLQGNVIEQKEKLYCDHQLPRFLPVFVQHYLRKTDQSRDLLLLEQTFLLDFSKWLFDQKLTTLLVLKESARFVINRKLQQQGEQ